MIARLRLMLADIAAKETQLQGMCQQYREQRKKVVGYCLYSETSLESSLGLLGDIAERLRDSEQMLENLALIRRKAESELESLQLTKGVEQAKAELADLLRRQASRETGPTVNQADMSGEIRRRQT